MLGVKLPELPINLVLDDIKGALATSNAVVLAAPPGAGKTTIVPLHLLSASWLQNKKIIITEPRRLPVRAASRQMSSLANTTLGGLVGYRIRMETKVSKATRIEVVSEGVFLRQIQNDPELNGVGLVIFDEFHERSVEADLALALALDAQAGLCPDLKILIMSATIDVAPISKFLKNAPIISSEGKSFDVDVRYHTLKERGLDCAEVARLVAKVVMAETGSILVFLPGQNEICRVKQALKRFQFENVQIAPLYGNLPPSAQDLAIKPAANGMRKIVLSTPIAESSLTIDGIKIVIDSGLQRVPVYEPQTGITRLETRKISMASANQRAGRAGRTQAGIAIRLWKKEQNGARAPYNMPQILNADLSSFLLDCLSWGVRSPKELKFLNQPTEGDLKEARTLLLSLGAIDGNDRPTATGALMGSLGMPVRIAAMVLKAAKMGSLREAAELAVFLSENIKNNTGVNIENSFLNFTKSNEQTNSKTRKMVNNICKSLRHETALVEEKICSTGALLALAYPDRIAKRRNAKSKNTDKTYYHLANGRGGFVDEGEPIEMHEYIVVADLTGQAKAQRILAAAPILLTEVNSMFLNQIFVEGGAYFYEAKKSVRAREFKKLGAITLSEKPLERPTEVQVFSVIKEALLRHKPTLFLSNFNWGNNSKQLRNRTIFLNFKEPGRWPDLSDVALLEHLDDWLMPIIGDSVSISDISPTALYNSLCLYVGYDCAQAINQAVPTHYSAPTGTKVPIEFVDGNARISIRVQELFGLCQHPAILNGREKITIELLSPARRPIQMTDDIVQFWQGTWRDVRKEMRGRYPKHYWPENPQDAIATSRVKSKS